MLHELITSHNAVFSKEHPAGILINERTGDSLDHTTVLSKAVSAKVFALSRNCVCTAGQSITLIIKEILFAINLVPLVLVVAQRVIVTSVLNTIIYNGIPSTKNLTLFAFYLIDAIACESK